MHIKRNLSFLTLSHVPVAQVDIPADSLILGVGQVNWERPGSLDLILACPEGSQPVKRTVWIVALGEEVLPSAQIAIVSGFVGTVSLGAGLSTVAVIVENQQEALIRAQHRKKV